MKYNEIEITSSGKINIVLLGSVHGNEVGSSIAIHHFLDPLHHLIMKDYYKNIHTLYTISFINKSGIKNNSRNIVYDSNINDTFGKSDIISELKETLKAITLEAKTTDKYLIVIDIHNSANVSPCFVIDNNSNNRDILFRTVYIHDYINKESTNRINCVISHSDTHTIKRFINELNHEENTNRYLGITLELPNIGISYNELEIQEISDRSICTVIKCIDTLAERIFDNHDNIIIPRNDNFCANNNGIVLFKNELNKFIDKGNVIYELRSIEDFELIEEITAPYNCVINNTMSKYYYYLGEYICTISEVKE